MNNRILSFLDGVFNRNYEYFNFQSVQKRDLRKMSTIISPEYFLFRKEYLACSDAYVVAFLTEQLKALNPDKEHPKVHEPDDSIHTIVWNDNFEKLPHTNPSNKFILYYLIVQEKQEDTFAFENRAHYEMVMVYNQFIHYRKKLVLIILARYSNGKWKFSHRRKMRYFIGN